MSVALQSAASSKEVKAVNVRIAQSEIETVSSAHGERADDEQQLRDVQVQMTEPIPSAVAPGTALQ